MQPDLVITLFKRCGALLEGHFHLSSGLHSGGYLQCALVLQHPEHAGALGAALGARVAHLNPTGVLSPALGGVIIGHEVARVLGVRSMFAERRNGTLTLGRGFRIDPGERILIVEDVVTTGGSTLETMAVAREQGGNVVGIAAIINRESLTASFDVPFEVLAAVSWPAYDSQDCPFCVQGLPVTQPGSRSS